MAKTLVRMLVLAPLLQACNDPVACRAMSDPAVRVTVLDSITNQPPDTDRVMAIAADGTFADTAIVPAWFSPALASGRPGRYRVEVLVDGYDRWVKNGVRVTSNECSVNTKDLTAKLQRSRN